MFYIFHIESDLVIKRFTSLIECNDFFTLKGYSENEYGINAEF